MIDPTDYTGLVNALRRHPDCCALIVWEAADTGDLDPDTVDWDAVEDRGIEIGHEVIHMTGSPAEVEG